MLTAAVTFNASPYTELLNSTSFYDSAKSQHFYLLPRNQQFSPLSRRLSLWRWLRFWFRFWFFFSFSLSFASWELFDMESAMPHEQQQTNIKVIYEYTQQAYKDMKDNVTKLDTRLSSFIAFSGVLLKFGLDLPPTHQWL
jgi:hypothetical protein